MSNHLEKISCQNMSPFYKTAIFFILNQSKDQIFRQKCEQEAANCRFLLHASFVCNSINLVESGKAESAKLPIPPIKQRAALLEDLIGKRRFWREWKKERDRDRRCLDSRLLFRRFQFLLLLLLRKCWNVWNVFFCWIFFRRVELNLVETFFTLNWRRRRFPHSNLPRNLKKGHVG